MTDHRPWILIFLMVLVNSAWCRAQESDEAVIARVRELHSSADTCEKFTCKEQVLTNYKIALELTDQHFGKDHRYYLECLQLTGLQNLYLEEYHVAIDLLEKALKRTERLFGKTDSLYGFLLFDLGDAYLAINDMEKAVNLLEKARSYFEIHARGYSEYLANIYLRLGDVYTEMEEFSNANKYADKSRQYIANGVGKEHEKYAQALETTANYYSFLSDYYQAEEYYLEAMRLAEKLDMVESDQYASLNNNMGIISMELGRYDEAEQYWKRANEIDLLISGGEPTVITDNYNNLAGLYELIGEYDKAEALYNRIFEILGNAQGDNTYAYAVSLMNYAGMLFDTGDLESAEMACQRSMNILARTTGKDHSSYAQALSIQALILQEKGDLDTAMKLQKEVLRITQANYGKENSQYASRIIEMGCLFMAHEKYHDAVNLIIEGLEIEKRISGGATINFVFDLYTLSRCQYFDNDLAGSSETAIRAGQLSREFLSKAATYLSGKELSNITRKFFLSVSDQLRFSMENKAYAELLSGELLNSLLFYKGFLLSAASSLRNHAIRDPESKLVFDDLQHMYQHLAFQLSLPEVERGDVTLIRYKIDSLEDELAAMVSVFTDAKKSVGWEDLKENLDTQDALIEFFHVEDLLDSSKVSYGALVFKKDMAAPTLIPLFEETDLRKLIGKDVVKRSDYVNKLYQIEDRGMNPAESPGPSLVDLIWKPLFPYLNDVKRIHYAPSGILHLLNLSAIPLDDVENVIDRYEMRLYRSTRSLYANHTLSTNDKALLIGGVHYEVDSLFLVSRGLPVRDRIELDIEAIDLGTEELLANRGGAWNYLKWTLREVEIINDILKEGGFHPVLLEGTVGSEESLKAISDMEDQPKVIHLATHGFFFPEPEVKDPSITSSVFQNSPDPMMRSGLILAGGNHIWTGQKPIDGVEDGVLSAMEISRMILDDNELVVLSACETGLGDIEGQEGVYGLQRAFKIAGSHFLIMSLWQVPDRETMQFMTTFYKKWVSEKKEIHVAFNETQKEMRDRFFNPYSWAGFVLLE